MPDEKAALRMILLNQMQIMLSFVVLLGDSTAHEREHLGKLTLAQAERCKSLLIELGWGNHAE